MAEVLQSPDDQHNDNAVSLTQNHDLPDWYLVYLVSIINGSEASLALTLYVNGLVISGVLVSGHKYFEALGLQLKETFGEGHDDTIENMTSARQMYIDDQSNAPAPMYIHMQNAKVFMPGQQPMPRDGVWWRGRLASVSGFHFGLLMVADESE